MVAYLSMAFGNPYGDFWSAEKTAEAFRMIADLGISQISLADTVGTADAALIRRVLAGIPVEASNETGVHLHSTREDAADKVLAAFDAGCRRFDGAIGGLGGCPFAQDALVGNIPTEEVLKALGRRGSNLALDFTAVEKLNAALSKEFADSAKG